jgi:hypothetical protein
MNEELHKHLNNMMLYKNISDVLIESKNCFTALSYQGEKNRNIKSKLGSLVTLNFEPESDVYNLFNIKRPVIILPSPAKN